VGLRYAAVAIAGNGLLIIGGSTPSAASNAIYRFDLTTHQVRQLGTLRHPITHGNSATLGSTVYLVGGRGDLINAQTSDIWAINPVTGRVTPAGRLPMPTSDAAVAAVGNAIIVAGGMSPTTTLGDVGELVPAGAA
jgi:N-acetylneuraminic acid mutarotase